MSETVDEEIDAIRSVLAALEPLDPEVRRNVIEYVLKRIRWPIGTGVASAIPILPETPLTAAVSQVGHIKELKEKKQPRSANEMSALVAYFLAELESPGKRKSSVNANDIKTYFKIAEFPLPQEIKMTLPNARNAGYFDPAGDGEYKLNAIGHNLVVHSMPRGAGSNKKAKKVQRARAK